MSVETFGIPAHVRYGGNTPNFSGDLSEYKSALDPRGAEPLRENPNREMAMHDFESRLPQPPLKGKRFDVVDNPEHYTSGNIECIDAIEASMSKEAFLGFLKGNVIKYNWRYETKGGVESLKKAAWYLNKLVAKQS